MEAEGKHHHGGGTTMEAEIRTIHGSSILI